jgi:hypothetical protein
MLPILYKRAGVYIGSHTNNSLKNILVKIFAAKLFTMPFIALATDNILLVNVHLFLKNRYL